MGKGKEDSFTVEKPDRRHLNQVTKVSIINDESRGQDVLLMRHDEKAAHLCCGPLKDSEPPSDYEGNIRQAPVEGAFLHKAH